MRARSGGDSGQRMWWRTALLAFALILFMAVIAVAVLRQAFSFAWLESSYWTGIQGLGTILAIAIAAYEFVTRDKTHDKTRDTARLLPSPPQIDAPPPPAGFVDREQVVNDIVTYLGGRDGVKAMELEGFGGLGKSSVAQRVVEVFRDTVKGRFKVISWHQCDEIRGVEGWARLLDEVARRHDYADITAYPDVQAKEGIVTELLAGEASLLILDNVEEKFPLERAMRVLTVRGKNGIGPSLLLTSRNAFAHPNLRRIDLDVLPESDGRQLFIQRVNSVSNGAQEIKPSESDDIDRICQEVGYLPLGIELTAVIVGRRIESVAKLARRLEQANSADAADAFPRLFATFTASYDPLLLEQRYTFAAFSLLAGADFSIDAAHQIARSCQLLAPGSLGGALSALFDHSLLQNFQLQGEVRCRMHPLLKQFARQKRLEMPEAIQHQLAQAVIDCFSTRIDTHDEREHARNQDYLNYVGAITLAFEEQSWRAVIRLCEAMGTYWYVSGQWFEGRKYLEMAVIAARNIGAKTSESRSLIELGRIAEEQGDVNVAKESLQRALDILQEIEATNKEEEVEHGIVDTLLELGRLNDKQGNYDPSHRFVQNSDKTAKEWFEECLQRAVDCQYLRLQGSALHELGVVSIHTTDFDGAEYWLTQALELRTKIDDKRGIGRTNHQFGRLNNRRAEAAKRRGNNREADKCTKLALEYLHKALAIAQHEKDDRGYSHTLREVGILQRRVGRADQARESLTEAVTIAHRLGDKLAEGEIREELSKLALDDGNRDIADSEARLSYSLFQAANAQPQLARVKALMSQNGWALPNENP